MKNPTAVNPVSIMNAVINPPVDVLIPPASMAAKGAGIKIRFKMLKFNEKFFDP